jgi:hypothetical protein
MSTQSRAVHGTSKSSRKPSRTARRSRSTHPRSWTCERCEVNVSWLPDFDAPKLPSGWVDDKKGTFCLLCRRAIAAEAALDDAPENMPREKRAKLRSTALIEFEVKRDPNRGNGEIAKACRSSIPAVAKARKRLGYDEPVRA